MLLQRARLPVDSAALHLSLDSIEQALRDAGWKVEGEGYRVAYAVAEDNLRVGHRVVADYVRESVQTILDFPSSPLDRGAVVRFHPSCTAVLTRRILLASLSVSMRSRISSQILQVPLARQLIHHGSRCNSCSHHRFGGGS
jgi:hypothetical protein